MSPEQARGDTREIDLRSDVYALGVLVYELHLGPGPYDTAVSLVAALRAICEQPPKPLQQTFRGGYRIDSDLQTIVGKALEKEPDRRYASADALAEDVERYLANEPILAHPPSTAYLLRKTISRHRVVAGLAAAILVLLAAGAVVTTSSRSGSAASATARSRRRLAPPRSTSSSRRRSAPPTRGSAGPAGVSLVEALKQAEGEVHGAFAGQPAVEAGVLETLARTYTGLGQHKEAETLLRRALKTRVTASGSTAGPDRRHDDGRSPASWGGRRSGTKRRSCGGRPSPSGRTGTGKRARRLAQAQDELAKSLIGKSAYPEAEKLVFESLQIRERLFGPQSAEVGEKLLTLVFLRPSRTTGSAPRRRRPDGSRSCADERTTVRNSASR